MRFLVRTCIVFMLALAALPAHAETVAGIEEAWRDWMSRHNRRAGGLAVLHKGTVVREATIGSVTSTTPVSLGSLSKAVTAVCVGQLIDRGKLTFDTPLSQALARTFVRIGRPADDRLPGVTVAQLLTHRAGFARDEWTPDPTTGPLGNYLRTATAREPAFDAQARLLMPGKLALAPGERHAYTNSTYLLLGLVIEEATGQPYESFCRDAVLVPLGAGSAELTPEWRILASYGGWRMTLADYGRFYQAFVPGNPAIGPVARRWMMSSEDKAPDPGAYYGLGTFVRPVGGDANFWHHGRWNFSREQMHDGPLRASYSAFAVRLARQDATVVVYAEPASIGTMPRELDHALFNAMGAIKRWP